MGTLWVHNAKAPRHSLSLYAHWFLLCKIILHADLLRTDMLGNFRWCCNVLAIENSSLFCLKCAAGAFFSSFTGSTTDCYLIYIQCMSWLAGTSGNFRGWGYLFFLIVTNLLRVTNLPVSPYIPSDLHYLIFLLPVFILSWWALYYWGGRTQVEKRGEARLFSFLNPWPATERKKNSKPNNLPGLLHSPPKGPCGAGEELEGLHVNPAPRVNSYQSTRGRKVPGPALLPCSESFCSVAVPPVACFR